MALLVSTNSRLPLSSRDSDRWGCATRRLPQDSSIGWRSWPEVPFWEAWRIRIHKRRRDAFGITSELCDSCKLLEWARTNAKAIGVSRWRPSLDGEFALPDAAADRLRQPRQPAPGARSDVPG